MAWEIDGHAYACDLPATLPFSNPLPILKGKGKDAWLPYQAPPHLWSEPDPAAPADRALVHLDHDDLGGGGKIVLPRPFERPLACIHSLPSPLLDEERRTLTVPRLPVDDTTAYALLGEPSSYSVTHTDDPLVHRPAHTFAGPWGWDAHAPLTDYTRDLGQVFGHLHIVQRLDPAFFSVVYTRGRLYVQLDPGRTYRIRDSVDSAVDDLATHLTRLSYLPHPDQSVLFAAFAHGYRAQAAGTGDEEGAEYVIDAICDQF